MDTPFEVSVLLVEDEFINAWALGNALKPHCKIRHASTKDEAIYWVQRESFHFVLLDIHLGQYTEAGIEILPLIKRLQPDCKVLATTGFGSEKDEVRFLSLGFDSFYPKPLDEQKIVEEIQDLKSRRRVA